MDAEIEDHLCAGRDVVNKLAGDFRGWKNLATYSNAFPRFLDALNRPQ